MKQRQRDSGYADPDGTEPQEVWACVEGCPIRLLDEQSGRRPSRGYYTESKGKPQVCGPMALDGPESTNPRWVSNRHNHYAGETGGASRFFPRFAGIDRELDKNDAQLTDTATGGLGEGQGTLEGDSGCDYGVSCESGATGLRAQEHGAIGSRGISEAESPPFEVIPFRYVAKASRRERNAGLEGMPEKPITELDKFATNPQFTDLRMEQQQQRFPKANHHPTVKPIALMRWLVRLVCPPNGTVLDPFMGSGSTGCAAVQEGFDFIGIEMDESYAEIARRRIAYWSLPEHGRPVQPAQKAVESEEVAGEEESWSDTLF